MKITQPLILDFNEKSFENIKASPMARPYFITHHIALPFVHAPNNPCKRITVIKFSKLKFVGSRICKFSRICKYAAFVRHT